jgi:hypothetical protein
MATKKRSALALERDKAYKAIGEGERTSHKVSFINKKDGTRFRRKNANQYGDAYGDNDYTESRANRSDKYCKGGSTCGCSGCKHKMGKGGSTGGYNYSIGGL